MASEDSAFVGHLNTKAATLGQTALQNHLLGQVAASFMAYGFVASAQDAGYGPKQYLAAAGLADMVTNILIIPPLAFNMSLNALVSQAMGSDNKKMAGTWLQMSMIWLSAAYLPVLISFFFVSPMLHLLGFDDDICELAGTYAKFNVFWPIPNGVYQCMRFYFQAQGITRPAMFNNIIFLFVNALLNWILVFGGPLQYGGIWNGLGFIGAAISLSCSRSLQPVFYWLYMFRWRKLHEETWPSLAERTFLKQQHIKEFLKMSLPQIGTLIFQAVVGQATTLLIAKLGELAIAASAASSAATMVLTGALSPTMSMLSGMRVGLYLGQNKPASAKRVADLSLFLGAAVTGLLSIIALIFARPIMAVVTDSQSVEDGAVEILPAVLLNSVASIVVSIATQGILTSQGRTWIVTILSMGFELPLSIGSTALLVFVFKAGLAEVFWAQAAVTLLEAVVILMFLRCSDWRKYATDAQERQASRQAPGSARQTQVATQTNTKSSPEGSGISLSEQESSSQNNTSAAEVPERGRGAL
eukprot:TRINITY_DN1566_c0_g2_i2.p1 TRINITY_DN1566_c0_g2~~TRINITY_DN1566_c0_g2_i2.p1  ORF type:complete len:616 (+),score=105.86 TRINITY_DN1566_c0_g2_i2:267-1850(+)